MNSSVKPLVLVSQNILPKGYEILGQYFDVITLNKELTPEIFSKLKNRNFFGLLTLLTDKIDSELINSFPDTLKIISNHAVGFNNIDIQACKRRNIIVGNTP